MHWRIWITWPVGRKGVGRMVALSALGALEECDSLSLAVGEGGALRTLRGLVTVGFELVEPPG